MKPLSIVSVAAEIAPFSKTGGLADVTRSLPKSLKRLGHSVIVVTPLYRKVIDAAALHLEKITDEMPLMIGKHSDVTVSFYKGELMKDLPIYFVSCDRYFGHKKTLYGSDHENRRFYVFDAAVLKLIVLLGITPDIVHCHDWHSGLIPELMKRDYKEYTPLANAATVFTIHNLTFQLGHDWWAVPGPKRDHGTAPLPDLYDDRHMERINFTKRAILNTDVINTVSETYAEEILRHNFGQDLHRILKNRKEKLFGVVNGIDYEDFNPEKDTALAVKYTYKKILRKNLNKEALQKRYKLDQDERAFVIVMASRITEQKGFDILLPTIEPLMQRNIQFIFMGDGDKTYIKEINKLIRKYPKRIALVSFDENKTDETMLYAGGDAALFPSRFEPCGTGQLKSMRYGCVPIAREIGGLTDTVEDFAHDTGSGNGFVFKEYNQQSLLMAITGAYSHFQHHRTWRSLMVRGMKQSNSWELPARKYLALYKKALQYKKNEKN